VCARTGALVICWAGRAGIVFCIYAAVAATALVREEVDQPPSRWWNSVRQQQLLMVVVVRGSRHIHVRANERERVAERRTTSARSYAPVLILALARGLRVTQEGIVGRGRVSE